MQLYIYRHWYIPVNTLPSPEDFSLVFQQLIFFSFGHFEHFPYVVLLLHRLLDFYYTEQKIEKTDT